MPPNIPIGILTGVISLIGFLTNWCIVVTMWKATRLRQPFAVLTVGLAASDAVFSTLYLFYTTPMVLFDFPTLEKWSTVCGYMLMICYDAGTIIHFVISLNRFMAVFTPMLYHTLFSATFTKYILAGVFLYTFTIITVFFQLLGCENHYNPEVWAFRYSEESVCTVFALYGDFYEILFFTFLSAILDALTILMVLQMRAKTERNRKELNFLKQSIGQTCLVLTIVISFTWGPRFIPGKNFEFIFSSILWLSVHAFDGYAASKYSKNRTHRLFTLVFNGEIRKQISAGSTFVVKSSFVSGVRTLH